MADQLGTLAGVRTRLRLLVADTGDDTFLTTLLESVSAFVQDRCHRRLIAETLTNVLVDTAAGSRIEVPRGVRSVSSLALATGDQPDDGSGTYTAVAAADILLRPGQLERRPGWPADTILLKGAAPRIVRSTLNGAKITMDVDFATVPLPIVAVVEEAVVVAYNASQGGTGEGIGEGNTQVPDWAEYFPDGSPQAATLQRYTIGSRIGIG